MRVELDFVERVDRLARLSRVSRAVLFDNVDTAKMHGRDMSNVSSQVETSGNWAIPKLICLHAALEAVL